MIDRLPFDLQVQLYPMLLKQTLGLDCKAVCYNMIRKPTIRQRQNETFDDYVSRLSSQYVDRVDFYFYREEVRYNRRYIEKVLEDATQIADEIKMYHDLEEKEVLDPKTWYRNSNACFNYGRCPYFNICKHGARTDQLMMFKERSPGPSEKGYLKKLAQPKKAVKKKSRKKKKNG